MVGLPWTSRCYLSFRTIQRRTETTALSTTMLVMGTYTFKWGLLTTMSPGRRKSGIFTSQGQRSPTAIRAMPAMIRMRCMVRNFGGNSPTLSVHVSEAGTGSRGQSERLSSVSILCQRSYFLKS
jgi:hypothetical protein